MQVIRIAAVARAVLSEVAAGENDQAQVIENFLTEMVENEGGMKRAMFALVDSW